ncbi:hypothetical protein HPB50_028152 [Hyalomma asiaticum]|nr:hypothetical protein HPB50_028152 [Hyalomma asiaticum]
MLPLTLARDPGVFADIKETVPVLCALTEKLAERADRRSMENAERRVRSAGNRLVRRKGGEPRADAVKGPR